MASSSGIIDIWGDAYQSVGLDSSGNGGNPTAGLATAVAPDSVTQTRPWHPESPLFWAGAFLAAAFGLIGLSTAVRVGPARARASLGNAGEGGS